MKKIVFSLLLMVSIISVRAQLVLTNDTVYLTTSTTPTDIFDVYGYCRNAGNTPISVRWEIVDTTQQPCWNFTGFCDKNLCYLFGLHQTHTFTLQKDSVGYMKLDVQPNCCVGGGHVRVHLWNIADSANTSTYLTYILNFTSNSSACTNGISTVAANLISMYPNPVRNTLTVSLPQVLTNTKLEIYNLLGSKVYARGLNARDMDQSFDLSSIETGMYMARITENGKIIATRRFTKED